MDTDVQEQLAELRRKIASIDRKYATATPATFTPRPGALRPARYFVEELISGTVVQTSGGEHFETEKLYASHRRHGSVDISSLIELPEDLLDSLSGGTILRSHPRRWAFLDTETTGLAGGAGTYAFLVGVGSIDEEGFRVRQFFMRDFADEASLLGGLADYLSRFDVLITYNGKSYDQPLLETRYRMARARPPFARMAHLDLLHGARRLWKLRLDSCRLVELENRILGLEREGDLPGEMIPYYYFQYLRTQQAFQLVPIFHHNVMDIVSLACLTAVVPFAFRSPEESTLRHGADLVGLARWLAQAARHEEAVRLFRRAVDLGLPDELLFKTMWEIGRLEKKLERYALALAVYTDLAAAKNPYRAPALEELAKYYERRERNYGMALEMTRAALAIEDTAPLRRREQRLQGRLAGRKLPLTVSGPPL
ncbi:MAG TPA: ribonuclease H-like domain-containing protein [Bryobacteraceae bacterium]|nr:ribonuclease H-like domain-containing protein [Bryobacteraceae bacterium]